MSEPKSLSLFKMVPVVGFKYHSNKMQSFELYVKFNVHMSI